MTNWHHKTIGALADASMRCAKNHDLSEEARQRFATAYQRIKTITAPQGVTDRSLADRALEVLCNACRESELYDCATRRPLLIDCELIRDAS